MRAPLTFLLALVSGVLLLAAIATLPVGLVLLAPSVLFAFGAYLTRARLPSPRPWLLLAVLALLASFVPWAALFDRRWLFLNLFMTLLAAGSLYANVKGEQRRLREERLIEEGRRSLGGTPEL
jgi:hydrogenase/urease accessory protein HupE